MKIRRKILMFSFVGVGLIIYFNAIGRVNRRYDPPHSVSLAVSVDDNQANFRGNVENKLTFKHDFSFPQPRLMLPLQDIQRSTWIHHLYKYLNSLSQSVKQIYLLTSNFKYIDVLLNWLISSVIRNHIPIQKILILSMDNKVHTILRSRRFCSVFIPTSSLFSPKYKFGTTFEMVMMLRLALMRIINHFGFDVLMCDTDAIMLRDPQPLFDKLANKDIVGSVGTIPEDLFVHWNVTICIGAVLVRSTDKTEQYWNGMKDIHQECVDDQGKLNYGLKALNVTWKNSNSNHYNTTIQGTGSNGLEVSILPYKDVCRLNKCELAKRSKYYIWHKGGLRTRREKFKSAREGKTWFLMYKWDTIHNGFLGRDWLKSIAYMGLTMSL